MGGREEERKGKGVEENQRAVTGRGISGRLVGAPGSSAQGLPRDMALCSFCGALGPLEGALPGAPGLSTPSHPLQTEVLARFPSLWLWACS